MKIIGNKIHYDNHNVVCAPASATAKYMQTMADALTPDGDAKLHTAQLNSFTHLVRERWSIEVQTTAQQAAAQ